MSEGDFYGFLGVILLATIFGVITGYCNYKEYDTRSAVFGIIGLVLFLTPFGMIIPDNVNGFVMLLATCYAGWLYLTITYFFRRYFEYRKRQREIIENRKNEK